LLVAAGYEASLDFLDIPSCIPLESKLPHTDDNFHGSQIGNEIPCCVGGEGDILGFHGLAPQRCFRAVHGSTIRGRFSDNKKYNLTGGIVLRVESE
jgi:hypothetical protein